jgi:hypothetical protein
VRSERGQALIELLAGLPLMVTAGLVLLQLLAAGYSAVLAGAAAEAGALALAGGGDARAAVGDALPGWSSGRAKVEVRGGTVSVRLLPPSPIGALARRLEVEGDAAVELR